MQTEVKVIEHSINPYNGVELITLQLKFPRMILAEFNTHRVFSRNASSTRAIPTKKLIRQIWDDPMMPLVYGSNKSGMQAGDELTGWRKPAARIVWKLASKFACGFSYLLTKIGLHKQWAGRIIEPWMYTSVVVTSTEWDNFFTLRFHKDAQPEIYDLAEKMFYALVNSDGVVRVMHLPYVSEPERAKYNYTHCAKLSTSRCARVSFLTHDGKTPEEKKDFDLFEKLVGSIPLHASPTEHQAVAVEPVKFHKNFLGWKQFRSEVEEKFL